jgi:hypothetical protein
LGRIIHAFVLVYAGLCLFMAPSIYSQEDSLGVDPWQVRNFSPKDSGGLPRNWAAVQDHRGIMYFGNSAGVLEFDSTAWNVIPLPNQAAATSMAIDPSGRIYTGGRGEIGYLAPNAKGQMVYVSLVPLIPDEFRAFGDAVIQTVLLPDGVAFLSDHYLFLYRDNRVDVVASQDHFFSCAFAAGALYVIDGGLGLSRISNREMLPVEGGEALRSYALFATVEDHLFILDFTAGAVVYDPAQQGTSAFSTRFQALHFLKDNTIISAISLQDGGYAFGSIKHGVLVVDRDGNTTGLFDRTKGLVNSDINHIFQNSRGNLWLSLNQGVALANLSPDQTGETAAQVAGSGRVESPPFTAYIRKCEGIFDDALVFAGAYYDSIGGIQQQDPAGWPLITVPYTYNAFRFTFSSSEFENANDVAYMCYLEGLELDVENASWSKRTYREFTNLYWGNYTLHVLARNPAGDISREAVFSFVISTPWYESLWFALAQVAFVLMLLVFSALLNRAGKGEKTSETLVVLSVLIPFEYALNSMESVIGIYTSEIAFFTVLITVIISMMLHPAEDLIHMTLRRITMKKPS